MNLVYVRVLFVLFATVWIHENVGGMHLPYVPLVCNS